MFTSHIKPTLFLLFLSLSVFSHADTYCVVEAATLIGFKEGEQKASSYTMNVEGQEIFINKLDRFSPLGPYSLSITDKPNFMGCESDVKCGDPNMWEKFFLLSDGKFVFYSQPGHLLDGFSLAHFSKMGHCYTDQTKTKLKTW